MHEAVAPGALDQAARYEAADREVRVQAVPAWMPLRHPHIRESSRVELRAQLAEEPGQIVAQLAWIVAAFAPVGQRPEPVEPVRGRVAAQLRARPPTRFLCRPLNVRRAALHRWPTPYRQAATTLRGIGVERERPERLNT